MPKAKPLTIGQRLEKLEDTIAQLTTNIGKLASRIHSLEVQNEDEEEEDRKRSVLIVAKPNPHSDNRAVLYLQAEMGEGEYAWTTLRQSAKVLDTPEIARRAIEQMMGWAAETDDEDEDYDLEKINLPDDYQEPTWEEV